MTVSSFDAAAAVGVARLWQRTCEAGLSFADRACLALAAEVPEGVVVTADRAWAGMDLDVPVRLIR